MEHARLLIRTIVRAFYQTEHVVVIDALDIHKASVSPASAALLQS